MANGARAPGANAVAVINVEGGNVPPNGTQTTVAAVMPAITAVLGDGTDSKEECVAPFHSPHLTWDCLLNGPGVPVPEKISALIDSGSHTVFIDSRLADRLSLRWRKLPAPLEVNLAMGGGEEIDSLCENG